MRRMFQSDLFTSAHRGGRTIVGRPLVPMSMTNRPLRAKVHSLYQSAREVASAQQSQAGRASIRSLMATAA